MPNPRFRTIALCLAFTVSFGLLGAALLGGTALLVGNGMVRGYVPQGPADPGVARFYVTMNLTLLGAVAGAVIGGIGGVVLAIRRRSAFDHMRVLILLAALAAGAVSVVPLVLLAFGTYARIADFGVLNDFDLIGVLHLIAEAACWLGYGAAVLFCRRAYIARSLNPLRSRIIQTGLVVGAIGAMALETMWSSDPKINIPWGLFLWPIFAFLAVGVFSTLRPNPSTRSGPAGPAAGF